MSNGLNVETITKRPPAGLSLLEMALLGSETARKQVAKVLPVLSEKSPAGLSLIEWAMLGSPHAVEKIQTAVSGTNQ